MKPLTFEQLAACYRSAFERLFSPQLAAERGLLRAAGVPDHAVESLYAPCHRDFEAGFYAELSGLDIMEYHGIQYHLNAQLSGFDRRQLARAMDYLNLRVDKRGNEVPRTAMQQWAARQGKPQDPTQVDLELNLCALYRLTLAPSSLRASERENLIFACNGFWQAAPDSLKDRLGACNWPELKVEGIVHLVSNGLQSLLAEGPAEQYWAHLELGDA